MDAIFFLTGYAHYLETEKLSRPIFITSPLSDNLFLRKTPAMKYCNICRTERVFPMTEIFADFHNERYAGAYFRSNTPACGCGFPGFPASVGQPNLSIYGLYAAVETYSTLLLGYFIPEFFRIGLLFLCRIFDRSEKFCKSDIIEFAQF